MRSKGDYIQQESRFFLGMYITKNKGDLSAVVIQKGNINVYIITYSWNFPPET